MRLLQLSPENRERVGAIVRFAEREENHYLIGRSTWIPGARREFVAMLDTFRCVFSISVHKNGQRFRHMSLSIPRKDRSPNPYAAFTIASWCGFTGGVLERDVTIAPGPDWMLHVDEVDHCIVILQKCAP